ncbi:MBL fold metallo-hydrolase [Halopenitus sp. POP-27]|uniref:MBL fold metallo-hydrolase n=1 Tax=Halopenitus sp. POP-27 TaxID=2994425 RepID=UPI0024692D3B|nr:MBL fold metallo-hydrolase [Halopenitus sp. POP-27]
MQVTLIGTGSPIPTLERAGTSLVVETDTEMFLIDCGPNTVHRLMENEIDYGRIEDLFITHHHLDHNAAFYNFVFTSWAQGGRESLTVYGPDNTDTLVESMYDIYAEDLDYRTDIYPSAGITDIDTVRIDDGFSTTIDGHTITALSVDHSIETYALKVTDDETGETFVFSSDTRKLPALVDFARDADVLVQDACIGPYSEDAVPDDGFVWDQYRADSPYRSNAVEENHCSAADAADIASSAGVETLVLTHFLPYRDTDEMRRRATESFDGSVVIAEDGLELDV